VLSMLAAPTIAAAAAPAAPGASTLIPSSASGHASVNNTFTSGAFVMGQGNTATPTAAGITHLVVMGALALAGWYFLGRS